MHQNGIELKRIRLFYLWNGSKLYKSKCHRNAVESDNFVRMFNIYASKCNRNGVEIESKWYRNAIEFHRILLFCLWNESKLHKSKCHRNWIEIQSNWTILSGSLTYMHRNGVEMVSKCCRIAANSTVLSMKWVKPV